MIKERPAYANILIPVVLGMLSGFILLHPASIFIVNFFEKNIFDLNFILREAYSFVHVSMGTFFALLGGILGLIAGLYIFNLKRINLELSGIISRLEEHNRELHKKFGSGTDQLSVFVRRMWPTLNKIHKGVDLIKTESIGTVNMRQSGLLEITKANIETLFELIDVMMEAKKEKT